MEPIPPNVIPSASSPARGTADSGEKAGFPATVHSGASRFESILKSTAAGQKGPAKGRPPAQGGRRAAIAAKEAKAAAPTAPDDSLQGAGVAASGPDDAGSANADPVPLPAGPATSPPEVDPLLNQLSSGIQPAAAVGGENSAPAQAPGAGGPGTVSESPIAAASVPNGAGSTNADPVPVLAGAATSPPEGDPLLNQLSSGIHPAASGEENPAPAQVPGAGVPGTVSESPIAAASVPNGAGSTNADPVPVLAGAATFSSEGDSLLKQLSSGIHPAAAVGGENPEPAQGPRVGGPGTVSASPSAAASVPSDAGLAKADVPPVGYGNSDPAPEGARGAEDTRKKRDESSARAEGQAEPFATPPADGTRGVAERQAPPRPVGPASDPGVVRLEGKAFVITRKSDTSVEVTLAPPGVGKLEIEVVLEKGVVNARIIAADPAGREAIARSLPQIVEALARDGMNIGGFTVSLKERRNRTEDAAAYGAPRNPDARLLSAAPPVASASAASAGLVDIFV